MDGGGDVAALDQLEALGRDPPRRVRIEDDRAAESRPLSQDDVIAPGGDRGRGESELRVVLAGPDNSCVVLGGPVVDVEAGSVRDLHQLVEDDVQPIARRERARLDQRVPAPERTPFDSRERDRNALARPGPLDVAVVYLHASNSNLEPPRLSDEDVSFAERPRPERSRHDGADSAEREDAVDE